MLLNQSWTTVLNIIYGDEPSTSWLSGELHKRMKLSTVVQRPKRFQSSKMAECMMPKKHLNLGHQGFLREVVQGFPMIPPLLLKTTVAPQNCEDFLAWSAIAPLRRFAVPNSWRANSQALPHVVWKQTIIVSRYPHSYSSCSYDCHV